MRICILAAGAGGMYCGSCLRDNTLARALRRAGHEVGLVPLYTPLRTDVEDQSIGRVFYGGVNTYLQHATRLFRRTPRFVDWLFDRKWLLQLAGRLGAQTSPAKLGPFTLSILEGEAGPQVKELRRLIEFIKTDFRPDVVSIPNLMFIGMARMLRRELGAPVICELTGEDVFLDALVEPYKSEARRIIQKRSGDVARFVATSAYYAERMAEYIDIPRARIDVVYPGIPREHLSAPRAQRPADAPTTIGYLARICPEKGLDRLVDAFLRLRRMPGMANVRLLAAGWMANREWHSGIEDRLRLEATGFYKYVGEVDLPGKTAFLDQIDVLCVPTAYPEAKGIYVLEALARGVPVVLPAHGSFPELVGLTKGGVLAPPGHAEALAEAITGLFRDESARQRLGEKGRESVRDAFTDAHMAEKMLEVYQDAGESHRVSVASGNRQ